MKSKSKTLLDLDTIRLLFENAGIHNPLNIEPLGAGEFNSIYSATASGKSYVIKIAPNDPTNSLTYETDMMRQEVYFYSLMSEQAHIRVPKIYFVDFDHKIIPSNYFIMERLNGSQLDVAQLTADEQVFVNQKTAEMMAQMHSVRGELFGYRQNGLKDNWFLAISSMVENLICDAHRFHHNSSRGKKLLHYIQRNQLMLECVESRLVNFDLWSPNQFCIRENNELHLAWIDLERCFFGDRIADFVSQDFMKMSLDAKVIGIETYNHFTDAPLSITNDQRIRFAIMLGYLGLIMEVEKYARYSLFHLGWWRNVIVCKLLFRNCFEQLAQWSPN